MSRPRLVKLSLVLLPCLALLSLAFAQSPAPAAAPAAVQPLPRMPSLREQAGERQEWLEHRLTVILPEIMRRYGIDMWILSMREYAEDPVFFSMVSPTTFAARRRSIYVFHDQGPEKGVVRLALGGGDQGDL
ncbi:MAG TPA: Xaa-Pro aminopeptidase, partial [Thermoanaerobaculia bacterium]|nr:Xaa-Pro aminopeptidase [Thermoanaerobaculia bacterium]